MKQLRSHLTYANVVATLALLVAIGGGSFAVAKTAKIGTKQLKNSAVTERKLADGALSTPKMRDAVVTSPKIAIGAVSAKAFGQIQLVSASVGSGTAIANCPSGSRLLSGGGEANGLDRTVPEGNAWRATGTSNAIAYALCLL